MLTISGSVVVCSVPRLYPLILYNHFISENEYFNASSEDKEKAIFPFLLDLTEIFSPLLEGEEQIVGGVLELAYCRAAGDGQAFPTRESHRVLD